MSVLVSSSPLTGVAVVVAILMFSRAPHVGERSVRAAVSVSAAPRRYEVPHRMANERRKRGWCKRSWKNPPAALSRGEAPKMRHVVTAPPMAYAEPEPS